MNLAPGTRLGPYEIQSAIGAGGMGEIYKARDYPQLQFCRRLGVIVLLLSVAGLVLWDLLGDHGSAPPWS